MAALMQIALASGKRTDEYWDGGGLLNLEEGDRQLLSDWILRRHSSIFKCHCMELKTETVQRPTVGFATVGSCGQASCAACQKPIRERFLLKALDQFWHEDCLKCACCDCRLGEVGSTLFTKANLILCKRDYLRLFGTTGLCSACNKTIPAFEMVMKAKGNVYHLECFACQQCNHRFCVGDRFYLYDNKILCEYDYEERVLFASLPFTSQGLAQLKRQAQQMTETGVRDDGSSGYGSGDSPYDGR